MAALKSGVNILPASRNEIVDSLATCILMHTNYPSAPELQKFAEMFIPNASDEVPGGAVYMYEYIHKV
jgi:hypothetical protein